MTLTPRSICRRTFLALLVLASAAACSHKQVTIKEFATACPSREQLSAIQRNHYAMGDCVLVTPARSGLLIDQGSTWAEVDVGTGSIFVAPSDLR